MLVMLHALRHGTPNVTFATAHRNMGLRARTRIALRKKKVNMRNMKLAATS